MIFARPELEVASSCGHEKKGLMSDAGPPSIGRIRPKRSHEIAHSPWGVNLFVPRVGAFADRHLGQQTTGSVYRVSCKKQDGWMVFEDSPLTDYPLVLADLGDVALLKE